MPGVAVTELPLLLLRLPEGIHEKVAPAGDDETLSATPKPLQTAGADGVTVTVGTGFTLTTIWSLDAGQEPLTGKV